MRDIVDETDHSQIICVVPHEDYNFLVNAFDCEDEYSVFTYKFTEFSCTKRNKHKRVLIGTARYLLEKKPFYLESDIIVLFEIPMHSRKNSRSMSVDCDSYLKQSSLVESKLVITLIENNQVDLQLVSNLEREIGLEISPLYDRDVRAVNSSRNLKPTQNVVIARRYDFNADRSRNCVQSNIVTFSDRPSMWR